MGCFPTCQHSQVEQCWSDHPASNSSSSCLTSESISGLMKARSKCLLKATRRARSSARRRSAMSNTLTQQGLNNASSGSHNPDELCQEMPVNASKDRHKLAKPFQYRANNLLLLGNARMVHHATGDAQSQFRPRIILIQKLCRRPENSCWWFTRLVVKAFKTNINKMVYQVRLIQLPPVKVVHPENKTSATFWCSQQVLPKQAALRLNIFKLSNFWLWALVKVLHNWMHLLFRDDVGRESMSTSLNKWNTQAFGLAKKRETARTSNIATSSTGRKSKIRGNNSVGRNSDPFSALTSAVRSIEGTDLIFSPLVRKRHLALQTVYPCRKL